MSIQDGLDPNTDITVHLTTGSPELLVNITGLQALDRQIPAEIHFNVLGRPVLTGEDFTRGRGSVGGAVLPGQNRGFFEFCFVFSLLVSAG